MTDHFDQAESSTNTERYTLGDPYPNIYTDCDSATREKLEAIRIGVEKKYGIDEAIAMFRNAFMVARKDGARALRLLERFDYFVPADEPTEKLVDVTGILAQFNSDDRVEDEY
jgi:hypothetical protein